METEPAQRLLRSHPRPRVLASVRGRLGQARQYLLQSEAATPPPFSAEDFFQSVGRDLAAQDLSRLQRVINATGIILHTNMGRAPLAPSALNAVCAVAQGYSNLELDLNSGKRGGRGGQTEEITVPPDRCRGRHRRQQLRRRRPARADDARGRR